MPQLGVLIRGHLRLRFCSFLILFHFWNYIEQACLEATPEPCGFVAYLNNQWKTLLFKRFRGWPETTRIRSFLIQANKRNGLNLWNIMSVTTIWHILKTPLFCSFEVRILWGRRGSRGTNYIMPFYLKSPTFTQILEILGNEPKSAFSVEFLDYLDY